MKEYHVGHCFFTGSGESQTIFGNLYVRIDETIPVEDLGHSEDWKENGIGVGETPALIYWSNEERKLIVDFTKGVASESYIPIDPVRNNKKELTCVCPICDQSMSRELEQEDRYCSKCGTFLHFPL